MVLISKEHTTGMHGLPAKKCLAARHPHQQQRAMRSAFPASHITVHTAHCHSRRLHSAEEISCTQINNCVNTGYRAR